MRIKKGLSGKQDDHGDVGQRGANSGYIYPDDAYSHLTFQVIGSRLQLGCAEGKIISTALGLMHKSGE